MKKSLIFSILLAGLLSSCSNTDDVMPVTEQEQPNLFAKTRSIDQAVSITNQLLANLPSDSRSQTSVTRDDVQVITKHNSRSGEADTLLYAVNFENEEGFALISAPSNVEPVLAFTENGSFNSEETDNNEQFQYALGMVEDYVETTSTFPIVPGFPDQPAEPLLQFYYDTIWYQNTVVPKRISMQWDQRWPANLYCPNEIAGCAPIAIAQTASYFESPTSIDLTYSNRDINVQVLNWSQIKKHKSSNDTHLSLSPISRLTINDVCPATDEDHNAIGRFVRQIGQLGNASYYAESTGMTYSGISGVINQFFANKTITYGSYTTGIVDLLVGGGVALYTGFTNNSIGHAWVADGVIDVNYTVHLYKLTQAEPEVIYECINTEEVDKTYLHFNWGWGGNSDGYFLKGIFAPANRELDDDMEEADPGTVNYDFSEGVSYIHIK